jgi:hypothetical protein
MREKKRKLYNEKNKFYITIFVLYLVASSAELQATSGGHFASFCA